MKEDVAHLKASNKERGVKRAATENVSQGFHGILSTLLGKFNKNVQQLIDQGERR